MSLIVDHYGFHHDENLTFLHEGKMARCLTPGLEGLHSPFEVARGDKLPCPHRLHKPAPGPTIDHPLVKAMAPVPHEGLALHLPGDAGSTLWKMATMTGPGSPSFFIPWTIRRPLEKLTPLLTLTNASPLVILSYEARHFAMLERLLTLPRLRNVILCGPVRINGSEAVAPFTDEHPPSWPAVGAAMTHDFVRTKARNVAA